MVAPAWGVAGGLVLVRTNRWMKSAVAILVAVLAVAAWPTAAQGDETPDTVPFGPETGLFHVHQVKDLGCGIAAADMAGTPLDGAFLYATNVADDTCAKTQEDDSNAATFSPEARFTIHLVPMLDQPLELEENISIGATIWLWTENVGGVSPAFALKTAGWTSTVDTGAVLDPADVTLAPGGRAWHRFDVDFGPSPATFGAGPVALTVDLDITDEELRRVGAYRVGLGVAGDHKSSFALPLAEQVDEPGEPVFDWPPALDEASVQPGVQHVTSGAQCTTNFVFRDRTTDKLYMGTAAHCIDNVGVGGTSRISTTDGSPSIEATVAFSTWATPGVGSDFALMEIPKDREMDVHPAVIHFGGPTALADIPQIATGDKVITFGNSGLRPGPQALDWHEGYVTGRTTWYTSVYTVTPGIFGDSGSGIMTADGKAIGAASTIEYAPVPGRNHFGNIPPVIEWMNAHGWDLELQTWELLHPGFLPAPLG